jgi:hypothetical protein
MEQKASTAISCCVVAAGRVGHRGAMGMPFSSVPYTGPINWGTSFTA